MYGIPDPMLGILQGGSFQVGCYAAVYERYWPRRSPAQSAGTAGFAWVGAELSISPLPVESGTVTIDNSGAQRRRATLTVAPISSIIPTNVTSPLTPFRNMVVLYYCVGNDEYPLPAWPTLPPTGQTILLGCFTLTDVAAARSSSGDLTLTLDLQDMSQDISRQVLTQTYVTPNGTSMTAAAEQLMKYAAPDVIPWFQADATSALTSGSDSAPDLPNAAGYTWDPGQDPWEAAQEMAQAIGMELYFTPTGVCQMSYIANPAAQQPVWAYVDQQSLSQLGEPGPGGAAQITSITRTFSQSQVYNVVQMIVESANSNPSPDLLYTGTSFLAVVGDNDTTSPTYQFGPFGQSADVYYDQFNYQSGPALVAAKALLRQGLGAADVVEFTAIPNPAHECYDVIVVSCPDLGINVGTPGWYVIDTIELPLTPEKDMTITARRVVNVP